MIMTTIAFPHRRSASLRASDNNHRRARQGPRSGPFKSHFLKSPKVAAALNIIATTSVVLSSAGIVAGTWHR